MDNVADSAVYDFFSSLPPTGQVHCIWGCSLGHCEHQRLSHKALMFTMLSGHSSLAEG